MLASAYRGMEATQNIRSKDHQSEQTSDSEIGHFFMHGPVLAPKPLAIRIFGIMLSSKTHQGLVGIGSWPWMEIDMPIVVPIKASIRVS